ncbi:MAG: DUF4416 family protein [Thermodesulfovibrionales bacterium]|nr:DUF4416 family protein [Thermodesulfovibrionales bacterium]
MGRLREAEKAVLFTGILLAEEEITETVMPLLNKEFGEILYSTPLKEWKWTDYYRKEMGENLKRFFIFFKNIIDPSSLADIKLRTNEIEEIFSVSGKRRINLDPGYLTPSKVVLASTKNYCHRIYLGKGIYAEITLYYKDNTFKPHIFTYRDYAEPGTISIFNSAREMVKDLLKTL